MLRPAYHIYINVAERSNLVTFYTVGDDTGPLPSQIAYLTRRIHY